MQSTNRKKQFSVSTDAKHFDELNEYSIAILGKVFDEWIPSIQVARAIKYTNTQEIINLISNLGGLAADYLYEIPPLETVHCTEKESILAQNKILKKCRQVRNILLSEGDIQVRTKYLEHFEQLYKITEYGEEFVFGALNNTAEDDLIKMMVFIDESKTGQKFLDYICKFNDKFRKKLAEYKLSANPNDSLTGLNELIDKLDLYYRQPFYIGKNDVERSHKLIVLHKLSNLIHNSDDEALAQTFSSFSPVRLAKVLLPLHSEQQEKVLEPMSEDFAKSLKVEIKKQENKIAQTYKVKWANKSEKEIDELGDTIEEKMFLRAYRPLISLCNAVDRKEKELRSKESGGVEEPNCPYTFKELLNYSDNSIRKMLRVTLAEDIERAFFFARQDPALEKVYKIIPSLKKTHEISFEEVDGFIDEPDSLNAQKQIISYLDSLDNVNSESLSENEKTVKPHINDNYVNEREDTIPVFDKAALEEVYLTRDATGEHGAEVVRQVLEKGEQKKVLYASEDMLNAIEQMYVDFPNFAEVTEEIQISLKISYLTDSPIDIAPINLGGVPGIGKTEYVRTLCKRLGFEFFDISLVSMAAAHDLLGGSSQFKGANVGEVSRSLLLKGTTFQPCILLDEVDRAKNDPSYPIVPSLLSILDIDQKRSVRDRFLDIDINCSGVIFISTTNNYADMDEALKSRLTNFEIDAPSKEEMGSICQNIYKSYLKEKRLARFFSNVLDKPVLELLSTKVPREAKSLLIAAIKKAFIKAEREDGLITLELADVPSRKDSSAKGSSIGFIH